MKYVAPILFAIALIPAFVSAQTPSIQDVINSAVSLTVTPSPPGPNQNVIAVLQSSSIDLDTSIITWKLNGKTEHSGQGSKSFNFTSGPVGSQTTVSAVIAESGGGSLTESATISPAEVDLMWEGEGYIPPFYEGRAMWAHEGQITLFAVPHVLNANGTPINPNTLIYKWIQNDTVLGDS